MATMIAAVNSKPMSEEAFMSGFMTTSITMLHAVERQANVGNFSLHLENLRFKGWNALIKQSLRDADKHQNNDDTGDDEQNPCAPWLPLSARGLAIAVRHMGRREH